MKILVTLLLLLFVGAGGYFLVRAEGVRAADADSHESAHLHCPPCGMDMAADSALHEIGGMEFAICSERCKEVVEQDPSSFSDAAMVSGESR